MRRVGSRHTAMIEFFLVHEAHDLYTLLKRVRGAD